jgi:glutamyl-tRNA reductase
MTLIAIGLNHQTAPVALRERVAFAPEAVAAALRELRTRLGLREAAILSTCNRTEIYCSGDAAAGPGLIEWLAQHHELSQSQLAEFMYRHEDAAAVRHLFRVATGLDSLVLGEPQILGQVKDAYQRARSAGALEGALERLFQNTFAVAKRVRSDTRIGANPVSVAFAAVRLAHQVFAEFDRATALLIGAGDTIELVARHLAEARVHRLFIANRTLGNAQTLAERFEGHALALADIDRHLHEADVVICSTASLEPILRRASVEAAFRRRRGRPMLIVDLAVPRDVEPEVGALDDVFLYTVDDLGSVIEDNLRSRREAAREAEAIIELQVEHYLAWWRAQDGHGALRELRTGAEQMREEVLEKALAQLRGEANAEAALRFLATTLTNKLLHAPSANLRAAAMRGDSELLQAARRLFQPPERPSRDE